MIAVCGLACVLAGSPAEAAKCGVTATSVVFGAYNVFSVAPIDSTGTISINCSGNARNVAITISSGQSGSYGARTLRKAGEALAYNLYVDANRSTVWGNGSGGSQSYVVNPPNNVDVDLTVYGRVPPSQDISAGAYADSVTVTVNF